MDYLKGLKSIGIILYKKENNEFYILVKQPKDCEMQ